MQMEGECTVDGSEALPPLDSPGSQEPCAPSTPEQVRTQRPQESGQRNSGAG